MSKSETVKNKFVDYVVRDMMDDITIEEEFVRFGMSYNETPTGIFYDYEEWFDSGDRFDYMNYEESFISDLSILIRMHLANAYGIPWEDSKTDVSVSPILLKLYDIILKKVHHLWGRNKRLNESKKYTSDSIYMKIDNPKQHKFFNRIADKVVELVEVREKEGWGKSIFLTDLLDPRFPGQGTSLPRREEGYSDYQTFVSKMTPTMSDFFPMLENYWSIDDVSVNIFIIIKFIYPKLWNNFYKGEDNPEESTDYGGRALDYEENKEEVNESTSKQQKLIDVVTKDLLKSTSLSGIRWCRVRHKNFRTVKLPSGLSDWNAEDLLTIDVVPHTLHRYMIDTYGLTADDIKGVWLKYRNNLINTLEDNDPNPSTVMGESESKNNLEKLIDKLYKEIWGYLIVNKNEVHLDLPYFKDLSGDIQSIPYDPYRQDIGNFNRGFIYGELERFVAYHLKKTMDIGKKLQFRNYDPMVKPIAEKLIKSLYKEVVDKGFVEYDNLNESVDWSNKKGNKYHRNGMVNRIVDDFLKMTEIFGESIKFHMRQHIINNLRRHRDPYLIYVYDENGLSKESKDLLYEGLTNGVQWYMEQTGLINYHNQHDNTRPPEDVELLKMVIDTLYPIIVKGIVDYNEDEEWTMDTLNDSKFLGESTDITTKFVEKIPDIIRESSVPKYLDKIFNSVVKEIRFDVDKYGAVVIPFISKERYSSSTGGLETQEYTLSRHDRNTELRDGGILHSEFKSYFHKIYGLSEDESNELFRLVKKYIKDEVYYKSVLKEILQSVEDDYIQGYGATIEVTPERTIDLKKYEDFKEYLDWWYGDGLDFTDDMDKKLYDDVWDTLKNTITLNEGWPADPELDEEGNEKWDRMFPDKFYLKIFKLIDKDPEFFMSDTLQTLGFEGEEEYDILYNYFVNYSDRKDYYIDFTIDPEDIAYFFIDDDYDMVKIVKNLLEDNYDYDEWYTVSFDFDNYMLGNIDDRSWLDIAKIIEVDNITDAKELVSGNVKNEKLKGHHELMEMRIDDVQSIIAGEITHAQGDADISYLHDDILNEVNEWFKHGVFNFEKGEFVGRIEVGDVMSGEIGLSQLEADLTQGYPTFTELVHYVLSEELNEWGYLDDYVFVGSEKPYINTDKHFRYGGAGTINNQHFNDMLVERLSWEYSE